MKTKKLYTMGNLALVQEERKGVKMITVRDSAGLWNMSFMEQSNMYDLLPMFVASAQKSEAVALSLDATFHVLYMLSNIGLHPAETTNKLVEAYEELNKKIAEAIDQQTDKEQELKDGEEWLKHSKALEEMAGEAAEEAASEASSEAAENVEATKDASV